jgi:hypothetical protein
MSAPWPRFVERRAQPREPINAPARICYGPDYAFWADCVVRDISQGGAKIHLATIYKIPPRFVLLHYRAKTAFEAVMKWRRGEIVGMSFEARHDLTIGAADHMAKVHEAWLALREGVIS